MPPTKKKVKKGNKKLKKLQINNYYIRSEDPNMENREIRVDLVHKRGRTKKENENIVWSLIEPIIEEYPKVPDSEFRDVGWDIYDPEFGHAYVTIYRI